MSGMNLEQLDYKLLKALEAVLRHQSFEAAAVSLHLSQGAVSQRIKQLETLLAQPVLLRTQPLRPTPLGQQLLGHYQRVRQLESELAVQLEQQQGPQTLPLAVNADSLATWFIPALQPLLGAGRLVLNLMVEDESRTWQRMRSGEAIACVTSRAEGIAGSEAYFLGYMEYLCVATPEFAERYFAEGVSAESLRLAPAMVFDQHDDMQLQFLSQHFGLQPGQYPCHVVRSSEGFVALTEASGGYSLCARPQVEQQLAVGTLVDICPERMVRVPLFWHHWQLAGNLVIEVTDYLRAYTRQVLSQQTATE